MSRFLTAATILAASLTASAAAATPYWVDHGVTLNARSGPGTNYHVIGALPSCAKVHVVGYKHGWAKIKSGHGYYWVSAKYLQKHACRSNHTHSGHSHTHKYKNNY